VRISEASSPNGTGVGVPLQRRMSTIKSFSVQQTGGALNQQAVTSPLKGSPGTSSFKQNQRRDTSGRIMRGILTNKDLQESPLIPSASQSEQQNQGSYTHRDTRNNLDEKVTANDYAIANIAVRQDRRTRNKDRPDRPVWTPRRRSDGTMCGDESQSCVNSACVQASSDVVVPREYHVNLEGLSQSQHGVTLGFSDHAKDDTLLVDMSGGNWSEASGQSRYVEAAGAQFSQLNTDLISSLEQYTIHEEKSEMTSKIGDEKGQGSGRNNIAGENGHYRQVMRRLPASGMKELDGSSNVSDTKSPKRAGILGYGSHE
ncbi:hypothetical protein KI387_002562, partial [Taxus chinensis]